MEVIKYTANFSQEWNEFVALGKNATFLFDRNFMDYHKDRFEDCSLIVSDEHNIIAVFPANRKGDTVISHQGLSYGGLVLRKEERMLGVLRTLKAILEYLENEGVTKILYKEIPGFYNTVPAHEIQYALFLLDANLYRRDSAITVQLDAGIPYQTRRIRSIKNAQKAGVEIRYESVFQPFWEKILIPNLLARFGVAPVHSLEEITLLANALPGRIKQYSAYLNNEIMAGTTIFETDNTAHAQYISASNEGRKNGSLDYLFDNLIKNVFNEKDFFDFGICNENEGRDLNIGLLEWKEGFGGRTFSHNFYEINTGNHNLLNRFLA